MSAKTLYLRAWFAAPPGWPLTSSATLELARRRYRKAWKAIGGAHPSKQIHAYRLDNPYMAEHVWRLMLGMAKLEQLGKDLKSIRKGK